MAASNTPPSRNRVRLLLSAEAITNLSIGLAAYLFNPAIAIALILPILSSIFFSEKKLSLLGLKHPQSDSKHFTWTASLSTATASAFLIGALLLLDNAPAIGGNVYIAAALLGAVGTFMLLASTKKPMKDAIMHIENEFGVSKNSALDAEGNSLYHENSTPSMNFGVGDGALLYSAPRTERTASTVPAGGGGDNNDKKKKGFFGN